jgi:hypothetical protein
MSLAPEELGSVGINEDDICNRFKCEGTMQFEHPADCSCHINPPCHACVNNLPVCSECGARADDLEAK